MLELFEMAGASISASQQILLGAIGTVKNGLLNGLLTQIEIWTFSYV